MEKQTGSKNVINNAFYDTLGEQWYAAENHPVALLRAENAVRVPWVIDEIQKHYKKNINVLDIGCGAGFLTNALALEKHLVTGIDLSEQSLQVAQQHDVTGTVKYMTGNAYALPFENQSFDAVCAMDVLEHVENPQLLIAEAGRVLRPGGLFFFHTFNKNFLSYLIIIKGVDWFVKNAPKNMHIYDLFIPPQELKEMCKNSGINVKVLKGFRPVIWQKPFWKMLATRVVPQGFKFTFSRSLATGYSGYGVKE